MTSPALGARVSLAATPTPLERADRLAELLGLRPGRLWIKRDDLTGLAGGGQKARMLEYLCADAVAAGADTLVTGAGPASNHVRLSAAAARRLGMRCEAVIGGDRPAEPAGNILLAHLLGARFTWIGPATLAQAAQRVRALAAELAQAGARPYALPVGSASKTGSLGYVRLAAELDEQLPGADLVVAGNATGMTFCGLAAGLGSFRRLLGVDVGAMPFPAGKLLADTAEVAALAGLGPPAGQPVMDWGQVGAGYQHETPAARDARRLAAAAEGILLDPIYGARALAGLRDAVRSGRVPATARVIFIHTGGLPAVFTGSRPDW
ncbi:MAG TPA: pyridoxal-phosphate dependent enzyme [Streptosporangiaceae bacterium]